MSLFAELFNEMLIRDSAFKLYSAIQVRKVLQNNAFFTFRLRLRDQRRRRRRKRKRKRRKTRRRRRRIRKESLQLRRVRGRLQLLLGMRKKWRRRGRQVLRWSRKKKRFVQQIFSLFGPNLGILQNLFFEQILFSR